MQTSYERIKNALYFGTPDRLPMDFPEYGNSDFHYIQWNQIGTGDRNQRNTLDEWGCIWSRSEVANMGLVTGHPLSDWKNLDTYAFPNPDNEDFYTGIEDQFAGSTDRYIRTGIFALLFERLHHLRGFENTLMDLYLEREKLEKLADRIVEYDLAIIKNLSTRFPGKIHGFDFSDDWGTERSTFISVPLFNDFFKPRYQKIFDACKKAGWDIWMHSCGKINDFLPSLIEIGVNALNMQQPQTNGISEIGANFSGKVCFYTSCDIQTTLVRGNDQAIQEEAVQLMQNWGTPQGGFICVDYGDSAAIGCDPAKKRIMYNAFLQNDPWRTEKR